MDYSSPGLSIHGIFQARVLEWGAIAFSYSSLLLSISLFFFFIFSLFRCSNVGCIYFLQHLYILFLYNFIYLFIFSCAGSLLLHKLFSNCDEHGLHFTAVLGFSVQWFLLFQIMDIRACRLQSLWHIGSVVADPRL